VRSPLPAPGYAAPLGGDDTVEKGRIGLGLRRREIKCRQPVNKSLDGLGERRVYGGVIGERLKRQGAIGLPSDFQRCQLHSETTIHNGRHLDFLRLAGQRVQSPACSRTTT